MRTATLLKVKARLRKGRERLYSERLYNAQRGASTKEAQG
jgi:hypothetical protein